jgi:AraC-like DNA-binding protein
MSGLTLVPNGFGHQFNNPEASCDDRIIGDFELIFFIGGSGVVNIRDKQYPCSLGDIVLIPPFTQHRIQTSKMEPHNNFWLHFDVFPLYKQQDFLSLLTSSENHRIPIHQEVFHELHLIYQKLENELERKQPGYLIFYNTFLKQIITFLLRSASINTSGSTKLHFSQNSLRNENEIVNRASEYILGRIEERITISDLCSHLYTSESFLFKAFSKVTGLAPGKFIQLLKIKRAEQMINTEGHSFRHISDSLGFSSLYHFSTVFKKYYGISPRDYKRCNKVSS